MRISITTRNHTLTIPTFHDSYASNTYLSNPCPRRTHEVAQQSTPLATSLAITCTSLKLCHFTSFLPFSIVCLQVFFGLPRLSFHQEPWSTQFWCSHCCPFGEHGLSISNAYPGLFLTLGLLMFVHIAVGSISCLASVSSKFSEDISGRLYRDSHHLFIRWFSRGQSNTLTQRWHLCWIFIAWS